MRGRRVSAPRQKVHVCRAAACGVERDVGVEKETHVVPGDVHVALVDVCDPGKSVEIFDRGRSGLMLDDTAGVDVADSEDLVSGLPLANSTTEKSNSRRQTKSMTLHSVRARSGVGGNRRSDKGDLDGGFAS